MLSEMFTRWLCGGHVPGAGWYHQCLHHEDHCQQPDCGPNGANGGWSGFQWMGQSTREPCHEDILFQSYKSRSISQRSGETES